MEEEEAMQSVRRRSRVIVLLGPRRHALRTRITREEAKLPSPPAPPLKPLMKYVVRTALALLILRHQAKPDALFGEKPAPLWSFVAATAVYWVIVGEMISWSMGRSWFYQVTLSSGVQSLLSLLSMLLSHPLWLLLPLPFYMLPLALFFAYAFIKPPIITVINKLRARALRSTNLPL